MWSRHISHPEVWVRVWNESWNSSNLGVGGIQFVRGGRTWKCPEGISDVMSSLETCWTSSRWSKVLFGHCWGRHQWLFHFRDGFLAAASLQDWPRAERFGDFYWKGKSMMMCMFCLCWYRIVILSMFALWIWVMYLFVCVGTHCWPRLWRSMPCWFPMGRNQGMGLRVQLFMCGETTLMGTLMLSYPRFAVWDRRKMSLRYTFSVLSHRMVHWTHRWMWR